MFKNWKPIIKAYKVHWGERGRLVHEALTENSIHSGSEEIAEEEGRDQLGERGRCESGGQDLFGCC